MIPITRTDIRLKADPRKVIIKSLDFGDPARVEPVVRHVFGLSELEAAEELQKIIDDFSHRHFNLEATFLNNFKRVSATIPGAFSKEKKLLIGAYFTHEYSNEASALFNPSIVPHPDQSKLEEGELRFVMSLRATGEGHISSIAFQTGKVSASGEVMLDQRGEKLSIGEKVADLQLDKSYILQIWEKEAPLGQFLQENLPERISKKDAMIVLDKIEPNNPTAVAEARTMLKKLFDENYDLHFPEQVPLNSRVLFPRSRSESNGLEDARFVLFQDKSSRAYYGTYTAYNGREIQPHLIETQDFQTFKIRPFGGRAASNKGMALFPEKINGRYAMVGRQGGRNMSIMYSDNLLFWEEHQLLQQPQRGWEMLQMGNCGSPVKTDKGWLLLTHAVGPMRKYVLSFTLLDLKHPERVLASLEQPFMSPNAEEREGYVPNVLYTCGLMEHNGNLVIPYAMSDSSISFVIAETRKVLEELLGG